TTLSATGSTSVPCPCSRDSCTQRSAPTSSASIASSTSASRIIRRGGCLRSLPPSSTLTYSPTISFSPCVFHTLSSPYSSSSAAECISTCTGGLCACPCSSPSSSWPSSSGWPRTSAPPQVPGSIRARTTPGTRCR